MREYFSFTTTQIQDKTNYIWAYDRCVLIRIYYNRLGLFHPLTLIIIFIRRCRWVRDGCFSKGLDYSKPFSLQYITVVPVE